ncbi:hypothetical protein F4678DRAFT_414710 [Xylaria arbuscula]|nr:hypothetical protein F4678DRAFT_414710 [Xylaria arbuscula]
MGSMRLGSQNTTPATIYNRGSGSGSGSSSNSDPQNFLQTRNKTTASPNLMKINNVNNTNNQNNNDTGNRPNSTRTVWASAKERGQAILRTGRSPAKNPPHITTISTTRNNNNTSHRNGATGAAGTSTTTNAAVVGAATRTRRAPPPPLVLTPPAPLTPSLRLATPTPLLAHTTKATTTNPSNRDTPPLQSLPPTTTTNTTRPQSRSHSRLHPRTLTPVPLAGVRRPPLDFRDQNAAPVLARVVKENKKMGHDTSINPTTTANSRPQMPSLSATAARGINRAPLTPKIASAARPSQPQTPHIATTTTTPLARRSQQYTTTTPAAAANGPSRTSSYDDPATISAAAFSPHLNSNVTPRSGSRQSRVDSATSTPTGTPTHDRSEGFPFASPLNQPDGPRRPLVTFNPVSPDRTAPLRQDVAANTRDSKFFHASDVKTTRQSASPKNPTFFYANGNGVASKTSSPATLSPPLSPGLNRSQENASSKFRYANGAPELRPTPPAMLSRSSSSASKGPTVRSAAALKRPGSPSKPPLHSPSSSHRNSIGSQSAMATAAAAPNSRAQASPPALAPSTPGLRRPGTATSRSSGHSRSGSLAKIEHSSDPLKLMASPSIGLFPAANLSPTNPPPLTLASIIQAAEEFTEHENEASPEEELEEQPEEHSGLQSPTKSTGSSADPVIELIANARRERKVQDLQIRNASLEAINRTLERQMRKQTAELRRYKRLSRASHLSLASTAMSSRVPSGTMSELELDSVGLSDLSEEDISMQDLEEDSLSDTDSVSSDMSPDALAAQDEKHRERDEERLNLDLSKHQQILVDSQKINQSIIRCIDWTEELINEGKKALEYSVRVSDIKLGGRVLDPLDEEEENSKLPTNDAVALDVKPIEMEPEIPTNWGIEPQDRDSGIELPRDGG